jgi:hypothetical protein
MKNKQQSEKTDSSSAESNTGAEVIDMPRPAPTIIQLTKTEMVEAENLNLKMRLLEAEYVGAKRQLFDADKVWSTGTASRLGVDLNMYKIDFATGTGRRKEVQ